MPPVRNIFDFLTMVMFFIDRFLVPLIFAIAFIVFLWGVYSFFIAGGGNAEKREEGKKFIMYGIIAFVIMIAVWGIVNLLLNSLGFDSRFRPALPTFGGSSQQQGVPGGTSGTGQFTLPAGSTCDPRNPQAACGSENSCSQIGSGPWQCTTFDRCNNDSDCDYSYEFCTANNVCQRNR